MFQKAAIFILAAMRTGSLMHSMSTHLMIIASLSGYSVYKVNYIAVIVEAL
jgi:hypothetical protein